MTAQFYRPQREDRGRSRLLYATALIIIVFLLDMVAGGRLRAAIRTPVSYVYLSLESARDTLLLNGIFSSKLALQEENTRLKSELSDYRTKDALYAAMKEENERLHSVSGLAEKVPGRAASVISSLYASAYGTFIIDTGIEEGVARGAVVFAPNGFAVGTVMETGSHSALVSQLFAPGKSVEAMVSGTSVVLVGQGGGNARAKAPRESEISVGDVVRSPQVDAPIGVVQHIESDATAADQELFVRIPTNLQTLSLVYVGRK
jgi:cell shape-determining protein MreC